MMAAELYTKTLAGYEASLSKANSVSLSKYCKIHHVNCRGLRYWMRKNSITAPKGKPSRVANRSISNRTDKPGTGLHQMLPLLIQSPIREIEKESTRGQSSLKGINIKTQTGLVVCIPEMSCMDLAELILSCNTR